MEVVVPVVTALLQFGVKALPYLAKEKQKKGTSTSDFQSKLERAESMLRETEPLIRKMKKVEGISKLEEVGRLIQTVEEGNQLVLEIRRSNGNHKKYGNKVEEWMQSFRDSLLIAMVQLHSSTATGEEQIRQHLLAKHQAPQILHVHMNFPAPALQRLSISLTKDQNYNNKIREFIDCVSMFGGLESLLQRRGLQPVSTHKTKVAEGIKVSNHKIKYAEGIKVSNHKTKDVDNPNHKTKDAEGIKVSNHKTRDAKGIKVNNHKTKDVDNPNHKTKDAERIKVSNHKTKDVKGIKVSSHKTKYAEGIKVSNHKTKDVNNPNHKTKDAERIKVSNHKTRDAKGIKVSTHKTKDAKGIKVSTHKTKDAKGFNQGSIPQAGSRPPCLVKRDDYKVFERET